RLRALGAATERQSWSFDRYDADGAVTVDGVEVTALPLFYEGVGDIAWTTPFVAEADALPAGSFPGLPALVHDVRSAAACLDVVATGSASGDLVAPNRSPAQPGAGLPVLLVAGDLAPQLRRASVRARMAARVVGGRTSNVVGRIGGGQDR